jgi:hypothetical protein
VFRRGRVSRPQATISGIPAKSAGGKTYVIRFTVRNGVGNAVVQRFTLRVGQSSRVPNLSSRGLLGLPAAAARRCFAAAGADCGVAAEDVGERRRDCVPLGTAFPGCGRQRVPLGRPATGTTHDDS